MPRLSVPTVKNNKKDPKAPKQMTMGLGGPEYRITPKTNPGDFKRFQAALAIEGKNTWVDSSGNVHKIIRTGGTVRSMFSTSSQKKGIVKRATKATLAAERARKRNAIGYQKELALQNEYGRNPEKPPLTPPFEIPKNPIKPPKKGSGVLKGFALPAFPSMMQMLDSGMAPYSQQIGEAAVTGNKKKAMELALKSSLGNKNYTPRQKQTMIRKYNINELGYKPKRVDKMKARAK